METLRMAFNDLPTAQREVLVSRELEGLSYETISNRTGLSRSAVESMLFRARRTLKDGYDDIATGERCQRMQTVMTHLTDGRIGLRQERRLVRHLRDCAGCRREAIALGLDDLALGAPSRTRSAVSRVAAFLPLPAFLRRRWIDGAGLAGSVGQGAAEQGVSLAGKAAIVLAAAAIAGGGAGVAHKSGALGTGGGSSKGTPATSGAGSSGKGLSSGASAGRGAGNQGPGRSSGGTGAGGGSGANGTGGGPGAGAGGNSGGPLGPVGGIVNGANGKAGAVAGGGLGGNAGGVANGVGGAVNGTVGGVGGTVDNTVKGVTGTLDTTTKGATDPISKTITGVTGSQPVSGTTDTLKKTVTGATGAASGVAGSLTSPTQPAPGSTSLPKLGL